MIEKSFQPDWVSPPGDTIEEMLSAQRLGPSDLAKSLGWSHAEVFKLLSGEKKITDRIADVLEKVLGNSCSFWVQRESNYRSDLARLNPESWLKAFPLNEMVKLDWLDLSEGCDRMTACLKFFDVSTVAQWRRRYRDVLETAAFRASPTFKSDAATVIAWLREGERQVQKLPRAPWNPAAFREVLNEVRGLTRETEPASFIPDLRHRCGQAGVLVGIVRAPSGCRASGAARFLASGHAMIQLSFRYLSDDHFWFTFFHEAAHLLLHSGQRVFLEGDSIAVSDMNESEANQFAANFLISPEARREMARLTIAPRPIMRFARKIGVSRGIVVGQLQHAGVIQQNQLNYLKGRFTWKDISHEMV